MKSWRDQLSGIENLDFLQSFAGGGIPKTCADALGSGISRGFLAGGGGAREQGLDLAQLSRSRTSAETPVIIAPSSKDRPGGKPPPEPKPRRRQHKIFLASTSVKLNIAWFRGQPGFRSYTARPF
jgi:hypothetical protein